MLIASVGRFSYGATLCSGSFRKISPQSLIGGYVKWQQRAQFAMSPLRECIVDVQQIECQRNVAAMRTSMSLLAGVRSTQRQLHSFAGIGHNPMRTHLYRKRMMFPSSNIRSMPRSNLTQAKASFVTTPLLHSSCGMSSSSSLQGVFHMFQKRSLPQVFQKLSLSTSICNKMAGNDKEQQPPSDSNKNKNSGIKSTLNSYRTRWKRMRTHYHEHHLFSTSRPSNKDGIQKMTPMRDSIRTARKQAVVFKDKLKERLHIQENIMTIPNLLCVLRIGAAPVIAHAIVSGNSDFAWWLFVTAGITDFLDGAIARTFPSQKSMFGSVLDPIADKVLIVSCAASLGLAGAIPAWLAGLILFKDATMLGATVYMRYTSLQALQSTPVKLEDYFNFSRPSVIVHPNRLAKANTAIQFTLFAYLIAQNAAVVPMLVPPYDYIAWGVTGFTTFGAGLSYAATSDSAVEFLGKRKEAVKAKTIQIKRNVQGAVKSGYRKRR